MGAMSILLVFVTFPDAAVARQIGTAMVESQLAACANLLPGIESIYRWQSKIEQAQEVLAMFKTTPERWPAFEQKMRELHPYEVPEIVAVKPEQVAATYAAWVVAETVGARER